MKRAPLFLFILLLFFGINLIHAEVADSTYGHFAISIRGDYGFLIAHRPVLVPLQEKHVTGFELSIAHLSYGKEEWEKDFLFPEKGLTIAYFNLGNPERLGYGLAIYPYLDFPFSNKKDSRFVFRYGIGLGWVEKIFNAERNYKNAAIGSHLNGVIHFDLHYEKDLSASSRLEMSAGITHYSNGAYELPNLGINVATINLAYTKFFGDKVVLQKNILSKNGIRKSEWNLYAGAGEKKIYPPGGKKYNAGVLSFLKTIPIKRKNSWGIGTDLFFDNSLAARLQLRGQTLKGTSDNLRFGIYGAYEMHVGKTGLIFNMGYYLFSRWKEDGNIYHRIGVRQYFNHVFLCMNLKTHYARADFVEFGLGYVFKKKKL